MTRIKHIPDPYSGWYLCPYVPKHRDWYGALVPVSPKPLQTGDTVRTCPRCLAIARRDGIRRQEVLDSYGDLLGVPDVETLALE